MNLIIEQPLHQGAEYHGKLYTRRIEQLAMQSVKVWTIACIEGRKPGIRPTNGKISLYAFGQWLVNNGLAKKPKKPKQMRLCE